MLLIQIKIPLSKNRLGNYNRLAIVFGIAQLRSKVHLCRSKSVLARSARVVVVVNCTNKIYGICGSRSLLGRSAMEAAVGGGKHY